MAYIDKYGVEFSDDRKTIVRCPEDFQGEYVIPDSVTSIGMKAFTDCSLLSNIEIPNSVISIGEYAFSRCTGLSGVTIPNSVISIERCAFSHCTGLTSVTIPDSVTDIGEYAFSECNKLKTIIIPNSVISIERGTFCGCYCLVSVIIPDNVTNIDPSAFSDCSGLTSVTIPNSVTNIGEYAFSDCYGLTSIEIPSSVKSIKKDAFENVPNVEFSGDAEGSPWGARCVNGFVEGWLVYNNASKTILHGCSANATGKITIPDSVTSIERCAFLDCYKLKDIIIPNSVTDIGNRAFAGCFGLISLEIPNSITFIGLDAFTFVSNVKFSGNIEGSPSPWGARCVNGFVEGWLVYNNASKTILHGCSANATGKITIPDSVTRIEDWAFYGCSGLTSVTIPNSVTDIGEYAFSNCTGLTNITIPNSIASIEWGAFNGCTGLRSVIIPDSVTNIGEYAFSDCCGLTSIEIPSSIKSIEKDDFSGCTGLTSVTIPNSVISIGSYAFKDCIKLRAIIIPNSVTSIEGGTFYRCYCLKEICVPKGQKAKFAQMDGLKDLARYIIERDNEELTILLNIAKGYEFGIGLQKSLPQAIITYIQAAEKGCAEAAYHLGEWYAKGEHVPQDLPKALEFFQQSAKSGFSDAQERADKIQNDIDEKNAEETRRQEEKRKRKEKERCQQAERKQAKEITHISKWLRKNCVNYFYHFTSRKNLASIRKNGGLYSWQYLKSHNIDIPVQGGGELSQGLDRYNGVADYVHLSFCIEHPMAYRHIQNGEDIVVLKISTDVAMLDGTMFSDMNAVDSKSNCAIGLKGLEKVNFEATKEKYLRNDDPLFKYKQAEILVKTHVPLKYILNIDEFLTE